MSNESTIDGQGITSALIIKDVEVVRLFLTKLGQRQGEYQAQWLELQARVQTRPNGEPTEHDVILTEDLLSLIGGVAALKAFVQQLLDTHLDKVQTRTVGTGKLEYVN